LSQITFNIIFIKALATFYRSSGTLGEME